MPKSLDQSFFKVLTHISPLLLCITESAVCTGSSAAAKSSDEELTTFGWKMLVVNQPVAVSLCQLARSISSM